MSVRDEIIGLSEEAEDLGAFLREACRLRGKGVTRCSEEAGLSRNTISSFVLGKRTPTLRSLHKLSRYFHVGEPRLRVLAGLPSLDGWRRFDELEERIRRLAEVLGPEEMDRWVEYGELLLLGRERRLMEVAREVEGESD